MAPLTSKSLWKYYIDCINQKFACFSGRARRKEFWGFTIFCDLIEFGLILGLFALNFSLDTIHSISVLYEIIFFLPTLALYVRRLHDINLSGWWLLTILVVVIIPFFESDKKENKYGNVPAGVLGE